MQTVFYKCFLVHFLASVCFLHLSSAAATGRFRTSDDIKNIKSSPVYRANRNSDLLEIVKAGIGANSGDNMVDAASSRVDRSRIVRSAGDDWQDSDEEFEPSYSEEVDFETAEDYLTELLHSTDKARTKELDFAIENYIASFCSNLIELVHKKMLVKLPQARHHSGHGHSHGHRSNRPKTRPKRSLSFLLPRQQKN